MPNKSGGETVPRNIRINAEDWAELVRYGAETAREPSEVIRRLVCWFLHHDETERGRILREAHNQITIEDEEIP